ncbi:hypothetical protein [Streptomyces triticiradicis]|uniref:HEXXH motif domain-containing protein n=1 Tax=Streptomyces triticiradicis TaxID=2651189 RepID=A0A7J5DGP1_9ACTN|nr:hypothetical protein [Streptomyces triticiradicis]KAB1987544.1 hypothetical protein F8144_17680 [Streptomyces triticiradicis]
MDLSEFDTVLSRGPFGDSEYLQQQMHAAFKRRLEHISTSIPAGHRLLTTLKQVDRQTEYRVLGDPLVRRAVQQLVVEEAVGAKPQLPPQLCAQLLDATVHHVESGVGAGPLLGGVDTAQWLGDASRTPWIWEPGQRDDIFAEAFSQLVEWQFRGGLSAATDADRAALREGARLLDQVLPLTSRSALSHTHLIGVTSGTGGWKGKASTSQFTVTGVIFLNRRLLTNPWWVAEHLLHEALHQKLYDFRHAHSLLARDLEDGSRRTTREAPRVVSLWNVPGPDASNRWNTHRAMAAFHVYVHLALFCSLAEHLSSQLRDTYGPLDAPRPMTSSRTAFERARYLGENLRASCWEELGVAGRHMLEWLSSILDAMDPAPPPAGASLHLLMDRYLKEVRRLRKVPPSDELTRTLQRLVATEANAFRAVLSAVDAQAQLDEADVALTPKSGHDHVEAFVQRRRYIADTLLRLAVNGYSLDGLCRRTGTSADEMVRDMVESSSHELATAAALEPV